MPIFSLHFVKVGRLVWRVRTRRIQFSLLTRRRDLCKHYCCLRKQRTYNTYDLWEFKSHQRAARSRRKSLYGIIHEWGKKMGGRRYVINAIRLLSIGGGTETNRHGRYRRMSSLTTKKKLSSKHQQCPTTVCSRVGQRPNFQRLVFTVRWVLLLDRRPSTCLRCIQNQSRMHS